MARHPDFILAGRLADVRNGGHPREHNESGELSPNWRAQDCDLVATLPRWFISVFDRILTAEVASYLKETVQKAAANHLMLDAQLHQTDCDKRTKPSTCSAMKNGISKSTLTASMAVFLGALRGFAQDTPAAPSTGASATATVTATTTEPVKLPYGVEDVLKMSRAQVSDDVIATYIQNTATIYSLGPNDIVYLKDQGVSDRIINTMLDQRRIANEVAAQAQQQQAAAQTPAAAADNNSPVTTPAYSESQPAAPAVTQPAASSLYVIPYPTPSYPYYGRPYYSYSYPYSYARYCYAPVVGFRFGLGARTFHASRSFHRR